MGTSAAQRESTRDAKRDEAMKRNSLTNVSNVNHSQRCYSQTITQFGVAHDARNKRDAVYAVSKHAPPTSLIFFSASLLM